MRLFYSIVDNCFWLIDLRRETFTRLTEKRLQEILRNAKNPGWENLDEVKQHPNHLFTV